MPCSRFALALLLLDFVEFYRVGASEPGQVRLSNVILVVRHQARMGSDPVLGEAVSTTNYLQKISGTPKQLA